MFSGNYEHFALTNQLEDEMREKLRTQVAAETEIRGVPESGKLFVLEWINDNDHVVGLGCNVQGQTRKLITDLKPGIFVAASNLSLLTRICELMGYHVQAYPKFLYRCNDFAVQDLLGNYAALANRRCVLAKICTPTVRDAFTIYRNFRKWPHSYRYVCVPLYWTVTLQVMFERMIRFEPSDKIPRVTMRWFDSALNCYLFPEPTIPVITFDIETVSNDENRVPTGEHMADELFTVSVHHTHTNLLYTLIYLPLRKTDTTAMRELILRDGYPKYAECENVLETFTTEKALLIRTMELLQLPDDRLHYLVGYNSLSYDIKYLLLRCAYYNLPQLQHFVYRSGYSYGFSQIHLDLFRIIMAQYKFKHYTLNEVSRQLLKETKTGVSAVRLRYTFHAMSKYQRYHTHEECGDRWPSVRDTLHYNNYDTLLVSKLLQKTRSIEFTLNQAHECRIPLSSLNTNFNKMRYKLWSKCFVVGLSIGVFQGAFKSNRASVKIFLENGMDIATVQIPLEDQLVNNDQKGGQSATIPYMYQMHNNLVKNIKYPGGANFCLGEFCVDDVQALDYRIAYPLAIDRKNISDETATILPANILLNYFPLLSDDQRATFKLYDYLTHTGSTKTETNILYHQYIYHGIYCGGEFPFVASELAKRKTAPVVIIWEGRRGVLSDIIVRFNTIREETKGKRKLLESVLSLLEERINEIREEKRQFEAIENFAVAAEDDSSVGGGDFDLEGDFGTEDTGGEFGAEETEGDFGVEDTEGDFGVEDTEGDFGAEETDGNLNEGEFGAEETDGNLNEGEFGAEDTEGDFGAEENEGDFGAEENEGDFGAEENEGDFGADEGEFGAEKDGDANNVQIENDGDFGAEEATGYGGANELAERRGWRERSTDSAIVARDGRGHCGDGLDHNANARLCRAEEGARLADAKGDARDGHVTDIGDPDTWQSVKKPRVDRDCENRNPFGFTFVNEYITVYENKTCAINETLLRELPYDRQLSVLEEIRNEASLELEKYANSYLLQKSLVASIVGTSSPVCASIITNCIRSTLLQAAQYVVSLGYELYYIDTDSLFVKPPPSEEALGRDISPELNRRFPHTEIEMKVYKRCMFVQKKTYYTVDDGKFKYFQHVNGSPAWRDFVNYIYAQNHVRTNRDISETFVRFFQQVYDQLFAIGSVTPELLAMVSQEVKIKSYYKTNTHLSKLKEYLRKEYPALAGSYKQTVYYDMGMDVKAVRFRPIVHLKTIEQLKEVNLFKFYQNVFKTVFNVLKFHVKRNNEPFTVTLAMNSVLASMITAFLDVHKARFPELHLDGTLLSSGEITADTPLLLECYESDTDE
ncbi:Antho-RFamide neuropeptides [Anthophora retusa]